MGSWIRRGAVAASAALLGLAAWAGQGGEISWGNDYEKAKKEAAKDGKIMILYFTATW